MPIPNIPTSDPAAPGGSLRRRLLAAALLVTVIGLAGLQPSADAHSGSGTATPANDRHHPWSSNGCGPVGFGHVIPDRVRHVFDFHHPCVHHDGCYQGYPTVDGVVRFQPRNACDFIFLRDMRASCHLLHGRDLTRTTRARQCASAASTYHQAVRRFGRASYRGPASLAG